MPDRIGEFLVTIGAMTGEQVEHAMRLQAGGDTRMFGEIALELGYLNDEAIKKYLDHVEKQKMRSGGEEEVEELDG